MKFGRFPLGELDGAILAHSLEAGGKTLRKGLRLGSGDLELLRAAGFERVMAAIIEDGDVGEDEAAARIAAALAGEGVRPARAFTGRANLIAEAGGVAVIDRDRLDRLNRTDERMTVASVAPFAGVARRQIVATIKIIPFAVPETVLDQALEAIAGDGAAIALARFRPHDAALILTEQPGANPKVLDKTRVAVAARLEAAGSRIATETRCPHDESALAEAIAAQARAGRNPIMVFGASAIVDRRDVIPTAIERAGGRIDHFGMPVDPGNLLLLGHLDKTAIIGLPGCARSPKLNGFDWVLQRLLAGIPIGPDDIMGFGVGGLLKDFAGRPQPREAPVKDELGAPATARLRVAALVLAAGRSRRMGAANKLLSEIAGKPVVRHVVEAATQSEAEPVIVVTGHEAERVKAALADMPVTFVHNPDYKMGLSSSLRAGLGALPEDTDGALICLGDMPRLRAEHLNRLIAAFDPLEGRRICVPTYRGKGGNPILWAAEFFPAMKSLEGDVGARTLIGEAPEAVCEVAVDDDAIFTDVDTPAALAALTGDKG